MKRLQQALVLIALSVGVYCIHLKADVWPLVLKGDAVPGTANFRFTGISGQAVVNSSGTIAFIGSFVDPSTSLTGQGIFKISAGQLMPVMMEGEALPDDAGNHFGVPAQPAINDNGDIVFSASNSNPYTYQAIFEQSNGVLRRIASIDAPVPGAPGQLFNGFGEVQINNQGSVAFVANTVNSAPGPGGSTGIYLFSSGTIQFVASAGSFAMNNRGDIVFPAQGLPPAFSVFSGGAVTTVSIPQSIPNSSSTVQSAGPPSINDTGDIAFISNTLTPLCCRGGNLVVPNAIVRLSQGALQKIVAPGDPVPGFSGSVFSTQFLNEQLNQSALLFEAVTTQTSAASNVDVVGQFRNGQLSTIVSSDQYVDGIGTLDLIGSPTFDTQQGPLIAFTALAAGGMESGLYAATAAQQYTLRFPHIADGGGGAAGGWRTTFVLANRSATAANATISFYADNGNPLSLVINGTPQTQTPIVVPALGVAEVQTQGGEPLTQGWALVQSDQNLTGLGIFGLLDGSGNSVTEVGVPASLPLSSMSVFAQNGATTSTGVALANPNSAAASVTLTLKDSNSVQLAQTMITLPPMGHVARYASELFPAIPPGEFQGKIEVLSTQPLAGLTLRQKGSIFTSLPVIP